jgi:vacuolar protein sorting-associated protein 41
LRPQTESEGSKSSPVPNTTGPSPRTPRQPALAAVPSNSIYIATSSIDGHVCVASLLDPKDVMLRNFARPVSAVALSPEFKNDRTYLSGGLAGNLILTVGGKSGVSANANTNSAAAAASGWLSSIGIGSNTGKDTVLHSGEGAISTIKWSLTGKFVVWVNEQGIKVMRTNLKLDSGDTDNAWTRIAHIDRPGRAQWEEMAGVWKARAEWLDDTNLEADNERPSANGQQTSDVVVASTTKRNKKTEKLVVGWGDAVWVLHVKSESKSNSKDTDKRTGGQASIIHQ